MEFSVHVLCKALVQQVCKGILIRVATTLLTMSSGAAVCEGTSARGQ